MIGTASLSTGGGSLTGIASGRRTLRGAAKQIFDILFGQTLSGLEHLVLGKVPSGCG
jgi:hypothetical protein